MKVDHQAPSWTEDCQVLLSSHALVLALVTALSWFSPRVVIAQSEQRRAEWLRTDTQHFEIHYVLALSGRVIDVARSAERAYDHVSNRLEFDLTTKVPLVMFAPSNAPTRDEAMAYAMSDAVAPRQPHRSRITLPLPDSDAALDPLVTHELTHILMSEIILPGRGGDGGVPRWVHEGIADYVVGVWSNDDERLMLDLVALGSVPSVSLLTGAGGFANARLNDTIGHAAFDYIESRWGATGIRRFLNALIVPRVDKTYSVVFELTPSQFDADFRRYVERRFSAVGRTQP